jgi:thiamine-monophosphate kinase
LQFRSAVAGQKPFPWHIAATGGEDYELLFTVKQDDYEKIRDIKGISIIGHMTAASEGKNMITPDGKSIPITAQGWDGMRGK